MSCEKRLNVQTFCRNSELLGDFKLDTFSSDYDEFVDEFGSEFDAHGA